MARVQIDLPDKFIYSTKLQVRIGDVAAGFHMGNHMLISYLNEALLLFFREAGVIGMFGTKMNLIDADLAVIYKTEAAHGDMLRVDLGIIPSGIYGFDAFYRVTNERTGEEIAIAKMAMLFFDYEQRQISPVPEAFTVALPKIYNRAIPSTE
ncbi:acyl-CoA thioesterase [Geobacter metallireducens GS-15]|uniref:Acyl-CoA thioesterase n=1 Tax=Geobacter metallireducens (strain ATCC 53774 / DSM 7210 / GS-15) TaxID=269799 RepID=Q39TG9_GEOMG|nr:thioesterase family protein [Geobacter metallireducens]ABB32455.1 acyl-CoA thioesterase [Geobacter metallireducens GS-15]